MIVIGTAVLWLVLVALLRGITSKSAPSPFTAARVTRTTAVFAEFNAVLGTNLPISPYKGWISESEYPLNMNPVP